MKSTFLNLICVWLLPHRQMAGIHNLGDNQTSASYVPIKKHGGTEEKRFLREGRCCWSAEIGSPSIIKGVLRFIIMLD